MTAFNVGDLVLTPTGRQAEVVRALTRSDDTRLLLRYLDRKGGEVALKPSLLQLVARSIGKRRTA